MLNILYLTVSFGVWRSGVLLIFYFTVHSSTPPAQVLEFFYSHCKERALVFKHLPNTAKFAHLHTHTHTPGLTDEASSSRDSPSPDKPLIKLVSPGPSQAFLWATRQRWVGLCVMQGRNCGSTSFPSPNDQEFPQAPLWVCAWLIMMGIAIHHGVRGLKLCQRKLSVNQRLIESNLISTRHILTAKKP